MFEISELKAKTLVELQGIAKEIGLTKISQLKKLDLVYQILDKQAVAPVKENKPKAPKPKRKRVAKPISTDTPKTEQKVKQPVRVEKPSPTKEVKKVETPKKEVETSKPKQENSSEDKKQPAKGGLYGRGSDDFERASDVTVQRQTVEGLVPDKTAPTMQQLEGLLGETFVPVYWDRASTNEIPTTIGRYSGLSAPATQGGIGFMRQAQPQLVASVPSIATKVEKDRKKQEV